MDNLLKDVKASWPIDDFHIRLYRELRDVIEEWNSRRQFEVVTAPVLMALAASAKEWTGTPEDWGITMRGSIGAVAEDVAEARLTADAAWARIKADFRDETT